VLYATRAGEALLVLDLELDWSDFLYDLIQANDVYGLWPLGRILHGQLDPLSFVEVPVALTLNDRVVNKDVLIKPIRANEAVSLHATEPLNSP
jgi:hypothetical protein